MRWATARAVSSSGPISAAMAMTVGTTSLRQAASGAPPCLRVGAITEGIGGPLAYQPYVLRHTNSVATEMLGEIQRRLPLAASETAMLRLLVLATFAASAGGCAALHGPSAEEASLRLRVGM